MQGESQSSINPILWDQPAELVSSATLQQLTCEFYQSSKLSTNGNYLLCSTDNSYIEYHEIPLQAIQKNLFYANETSSLVPEHDKFSLKARVDVGDALYDYQPHATMTDECGLPIVVTATRDHPIQLVSPTAQRVLGSYIPINHLDELDFTLSVAFNSTGEKIYSGSDRKIRSFDIATAGRTCSEFWTSESKKSFFGQKGLISCISFNPDYSGLYAAGSFAGDVSVYSENSGSQSFFDIIRLGYGVNSLLWSPCGRYLWVSGRNHPEISCWDVRGSKRKVGAISRSISTNQRHIFDIDPWGNCLISGDDRGRILYYNTKTFERMGEIDTGVCSTVNACHFHPFSAVVLASQGERTFPMQISSRDDSSDDDDDDTEDESQAKVPIQESIVESNCNPVEQKSNVPDDENQSCDNSDNYETKETVEDDLLMTLLGKRRALMEGQETVATCDESVYNGKTSNKIPIAKANRLHESICSESRILAYAFQKLHLSIPSQSVDCDPIHTTELNSKELNELLEEALMSKKRSFLEYQQEN